VVSGVRQGANAWQQQQQQVLLDRRMYLARAFSDLALASAVAVVSPVGRAFATETSGTDLLSYRFQSDVLKQPPLGSGTSSLTSSNVVDNTYFPSFMKGTWQVTQTLVNVSVPLGLAFAGGPSGVEEIASKALAESRERLNLPVQFQLRFVPTAWGVAEDRLFNTEQRLNAYAGRQVVASVEYANVGGSNRQSLLKLGGTEQDPLLTTLVRFKGPAAQKNFVTGHSGAQTPKDSDSNVWIGYETQRSLFALTNESTAPPIFTDSEALFRLQKLGDGKVKGQLRIVGYLNPTNKLYFEARNRAVSIQDYMLDMTSLGDL
jgi:hypothetical protein